MTLIKTAINPLFLVLLFLIFAQIGMRLRGQPSSKFLVASTLILYISSIPFVSNFLFHKLEYRIEHSSAAQLEKGSVILLMGGSVENRPENDRTYQLGYSGDRILKVLEISKMYPELEIWLSDQKISGSQKILTEMGVSADKIRILDEAKNTQNEISVFVSELNRQKYSMPIVVTSASHMARVISLLNDHKIDAASAHAAYKTPVTKNNKIHLFVPSPQALTANTIVLRETLASLLL